MPKILFTASTYSHIVQFHRPYLSAFRALGWTVDVACGGAPMEIPEAHRTIHLDFEKQMLSPRNGRALRQLRRTMRETAYDVVSCHTALASFFTRLAVNGGKQRPKVVCTVHGYLFGEHNPAVKGLILQAAEKLVASRTDLLMTMNRWDTQYAAAHRLGKKMVEIPGVGLDPSRLPPISREEASALRRQWGIEETDILLLYAAEFSGRKSQQVLLRALAQLPPQVKLALPGQGRLLEECVALARSLGIEQRVIFPGQVARMAQWYGAADIAVSASRSEGLPFNIMEAMYYGLPVVASAVKGHTDLLVPDACGLLYPYGDWQACAAQLQKLLQFPEERERMGQQGRQSVGAYCLDQVLPVIMAQYEALIPLREETLTHT